MVNPIYPTPKKPAPGAVLNAIRDGNSGLVRTLLSQNADVNERDPSGNSALSLAASSGYLDIVRQLVDKGANLDSRNTRGDTPLMMAISGYSANRETIVRLLLEKGANIDIKNNDGDTAMTLAVKRGRPQIVDMLKETAATRKRLAEEYAKAAEDKRRAALAERQQLLRDAAKNKPTLVPKPPKAA